MKTTISFQEILSIPLLVKDFIKGHLYDFKEFVFSKENFSSIIAKKEAFFSDEKRKILFEVLKKQHEGFDLTEKQKEHLQFLLSENTFTVTTGHQLNLFTGPVFFIYKILQTIKTCLYIKEIFPHQNFVPIFWMATEDHDFDEVNHFKTEQSYYEISKQNGGAVGRIKIHENDFIPRFEEELKGFPFVEELKIWVEEAYQKGNMMAQAIRYLVQKLFSEYGLLVIDGDDEALKIQMQDIFKDELLNQTVLTASQSKIDFLKENYGKVQVNPREINLFYLSDTRNRIELRNGLYYVLDKNLKFTQEEILEELEKNPKNFSPNVLLRPVFQETVLPNIAYVGGNAEVMYWLELVDYFKEIKLPFPILIPRNSFAFVQEKTFHKIEKIKMSVQDFFKDFKGMLESKLMNDTELSTLLKTEKVKVEEAFRILKNKAVLTDKSFLNLVEAEQTRQLRSFDRMKKRLLKAQKIKNQEQVDYIYRIANEISPNGIWQERQYNFSVFYGKMGKEWIRYCYENLSVENPLMIILSV